MRIEKNRPCVALVSGGLDSAVALAMAIDSGFSVRALTVDYGQRHLVEIESAKKVCEHLGVQEHKIVELDLRAFDGSSLTGDMDVPKSTTVSQPGQIPSTYVPARNTVLLSLALAFAESIGASDIFIGVSSVDYSGYPDCRPEFIDAFERAANKGTRAADSGDHITVHAPLIQMTKAQTVRAGLELGVDYAHTWTCYDPAPVSKPCGRCEACLLRARGFKEAGVADPLLEKK